MDIKINSLHFKTDQKLEVFIQNKVEKLANYYNGVIGADVSLKIANTQTNENKIAEIRLIIPGNDLYVKKQSKTFEESIDKSVDALKRQLTKHKNKLKGE
ncbi:MAG: ribosome-associated translation inhibitor RaiA [Lentimicrobiaceae bacterium]|nr:ribosome-associated translation inhibitor RaiA [Lentimicrobiaceae bacterium]